MTCKILCACEESQTVCSAFRRRGLDAWSCDIRPGSGEYPQYHIQGDVIPILRQQWDLVIAFPPCTHLAVSGAKHFAQKRKDGRQKIGIDFFMLFTKLKCRYAIENPIGIMSTLWRKPDQIIQPWQFGHEAQKSTCLWLHDLPLLQATDIVDKGEICTLSSGKRIPKWYSNCSNRKIKRAKTFPGIAQAMADQWGNLLRKE